MSAEQDRTDDLWADMTPDSLRDKAAAADQAAADSWERSDTDGFLSQWAHGLTADLHRTQARIVEAGGEHRFPALFDLQGNYVPAQTIEGRWGTRWHLLAASGFGTGVFLPYLPKRRQTLAKRGYVEGWVMRPAEAFMNGTGHGMSGRAWVDIRPTDLPWHTPRTIISTDRWADQPEERTA